ncbi:hypothetical protein D3C84_908860 [compost metagenome]
MIEFHILFLGKILKYDRENSLQHIFHPFRTKAVDGAKVWALSAGNPHEHDILSDGFGNLTRGIDPLCVSVDNDFGKHFGVVTVASSTGIRILENSVVQAVDRFINNTNKVIRRNVVLQIHWQM